MIEVIRVMEDVFWCNLVFVNFVGCLGWIVVLIVRMNGLVFVYCCNIILMLGWISCLFIDLFKFGVILKFRLYVVL